MRKIDPQINAEIKRAAMTKIDPQINTEIKREVKRYSEDHEVNGWAQLEPN